MRDSRVHRHNLVQPHLTVAKRVHIIDVVHYEERLDVVEVALGDVAEALGARRVREVQPHPDMALVEANGLCFEVHANCSSYRAELARVVRIRLD